MGDEDVLGVSRVAAQLGVEVRATVAKPTVAYNLHHGLREVKVVYRELVGVPSVLVVAPVGVYRPQHAVVDGHSQFVLKGVTSQRSVVNLDVHLEVLVKPVGAQEPDNRLGVNVILVLCGLHGFRLDEEGAGESLAAGIVACGSQHGCQVVFLALHLGVEQAHVALAASPEHIVGAAQLYRCVDGVLYLHCCTGHNVKVGVGGSTVHIALVAEHIGRSPE